jgi:hypothetical protein
MGALQKQPLAIVFESGLDTKTSSKLVAPTKLIDLQNAVFDKVGSLAKRNGYRAIGKLVDSTGVAYTGAVGLGTRQDELVLFAGGNSLSYRPTSDSWQTIGATQSIVAAGSALARTGTSQTTPDAATNRGVTALAWEDSQGGLWGAIVEAATERLLLPPTQLDASGKMPRCIAVGEVIHVLWVNSSVLWLSVVNPAAPSSFGAPQPLTTDLDPAAQGYDAFATFDSYDATNKPGFVAWVTPGGYRVGYIHPSGVLGSPVTGLPSPATFLLSSGAIGAAIGVAFTAGKVANVMQATVGVVYQSGVSSAAGYITADVINGTTFVRTGTVALISGSSFAVKWNRIAVEWGNATATGSLTLWWAGESNAATADTCSTLFGSLPIATMVPTTAQTIMGHSLASRAWNDNGAVYVSLAHPVLYFPYVAVVQISAGGRAQARLHPGLASGQLTRPILPSVSPIAPSAAPAVLAGPPSSYSRRHALTLGFRIQLTGTGGKQFGEQGIRLFSLDYDHADSFHTAVLGNGMYLAGALIQHYDGSRWSEHNFHCAPDTASGTIATSQAAGGALTTTATYNYKIIYEEIDAQGELHPGAQSIAIPVVLTGANNQVTLTIPTCRLTSKQHVRIGVFRSQANVNAGFNRVSSVNPTAAGANGYVTNDPTVDTLTFTDGMSDATAFTLEPIYTNGNILSNDPEQSGGAAIVGGKTRLFWLDPLDGNLVNYSQALRDDTAAEFSAALSVRVDPHGGDVIALAVMDDSVIIFKETAIFAFGGPGPDADGGSANPSNAWTQPQLVTTDVGCSSPGSIANVPDGIVFQSSKGPVLLDRSLQIKSIGDDVFGYRAQHISRATLLPDRPHIVFLTDVDQGRTLLYDYNRAAWSTFTNHVGLDAVVLGGSYYYLSADGTVYVETPGVYRDGTRHIKRRVETAWIKFSGYLQGWQKVLHVMILGTYYSRHRLSLSYRLDYEDGYTVLDPVDVNATYTPSLYGAGAYGVGNYSGSLGPNTVYQEQFHLNVRCQAISFAIEDVEESGDYGAAFDLSELLLVGGVVGVKFQPGPARSQ